MAKFILTCFFLIGLEAHADLFDFVTSSDGNDSRISLLVQKIKKLEIKEGSEFEESFNQLIKGIELAVEDEKLYCAGESANSKGKTLPASQKQFCIRELKKQYLLANEVIFETKKKYLTFIHQKQMMRLSEIQNNFKSDIEKSF